MVEQSVQHAKVQGSKPAHAVGQGRENDKKKLLFVKKLDYFNIE